MACKHCDYMGLEFTTVQYGPMTYMTANRCSKCNDVEAYTKYVELKYSTRYTDKDLQEFFDMAKKRKFIATVLEQDRDLAGMEKPPHICKVIDIKTREVVEIES